MSKSKEIFMVNNVLQSYKNKLKLQCMMTIANKLGGVIVNKVP